MRTNSTIAFLAEPSFHEASGSVCARTCVAEAKPTAVATTKTKRTRTCTFIAVSSAGLPIEHARGQADAAQRLPLDRSHRATVKGINPSETSSSGTDFACQWSWYRPGGNAGADAAITSARYRGWDEGLDDLPVLDDVHL